MALNLKADALHLRPIGYKLPYSPLALYARQKPLVLKFDKSTCTPQWAAFSKILCELREDISTKPVLGSTPLKDITPSNLSILPNQNS